jgi:hypothetical protein
LHPHKCFEESVKWLRDAVKNTGDDMMNKIIPLDREKWQDYEFPFHYV